MPGNDGFAFPFGNRPQNLTRRFLRRHHQPRCNGLFRFFMKLSLVVDPSDLTGYKARTDQRHRHSGQPQLRRNRIGQRANGELAHGVRRGAWRRRPARHTSNDSDVAFVFLDFGERRVNRSQHAKDVGLKLSPVILEREFLQWANHAKAGVGDRTSNFPHWRTVSATAVCKSPSWATSHRVTNGFVFPVAAILCARFSSNSLRRAASVSFAPACPNCHASSWPIPDEAPVTITTLFRKNDCVLFIRVSYDTAEESRGTPGKASEKKLKAQPPL